MTEKNYCIHGIVIWVLISLIVIYGFHNVYISHQGENVNSIIMVLTITIVSGIWGGIGSYSLIYLNRKSYDNSKVNSEDDINLIDELNPYVFLGVVSSNLVPLFLSVVSQGDINIFVNVKDGAVNNKELDWVGVFSLVGLCLIASVYSKNFIVKIGNKTLLDKMNKINHSNEKLDVKTERISEELHETKNKLSDERTKILYLNAFHIFNKYLDLKRRLLKSKRDPLDIPLNTNLPDSISSENKEKLKLYLDKAIEVLNDDMFALYDIDSSLLKCNCYRQLSVVTGDVSYIEKAYKCLSELIRNIKKEKVECIDGDIICININVICYAIALNKSEAEILMLTEDAIRMIKGNDFINQLTEDDEVIDYMASHHNYSEKINSYRNVSL